MKLYDGIVKTTFTSSIPDGIRHRYINFLYENINLNECSHAKPERAISNNIHMYIFVSV